ncbi:transposase, partial [Klebsiella pneumoniae]|nr:transposase [Klebsiella pneumoniae]
MGKQRKIWSPEVKEEIVLTVLSGEKSIAELARQHGVAESLIHNWRTQFLEAGRARLAGNKQDDGFRTLEKENERLKSLLGEKE